MQIKIKHQTRYIYENPILGGLQRVHLRPPSNVLQNVLSWDIKLENAQSILSYIDHFGNHTELIQLEKNSSFIAIEIEGEIETYDKIGVLGRCPSAIPKSVFLQSTEYTQLGPELRAVANNLSGFDGSLAAFHDLSNLIRKHVDYATDETHVETSAESAWTQGKGVCQDHAHIMITLSRALGFPARYISGYLLMNDREIQEASHAWCEVDVPTLGWVGFDVSNGYSPDERYVRLAIGRDYLDAIPVRGLRYGIGDETLDVSLQIQQ